MKRGTKVWLIVALIFALVGGGLCLSAAILGVTFDEVRQMVYDGDFAWRIGPFHSGWFEDDYRENSGNGHSSMEGNLNADGSEKVSLSSEIETFEVDMDYGSLLVKASYSNEAYLDAGEHADDFEWSFDGNMLLIRNTDGDHWNWGDLDSVKATLYLPKNIHFNDIEVDVDAGGCSIELPMECSNLYVDVDAGSATIKDMNAGWADLDCDAGKISFKGRVSDGGVVDVDAGSAEVVLTGAEVTDYNYSINVSAGSLTINDKSFSGLEDQQMLDNSAPADWELSCDAGKIKMDVKNK